MLSSRFAVVSLAVCLGLSATISASAVPRHVDDRSDAAADADGMDQNVTLPDGSVRNVREYLSEFVRDYKRMRQRLSPAQLRSASTVGLLAGMVRIEALMTAALSNRTHRFQPAVDAATGEQVLEHLYALDEQMRRDRSAVRLLGAALEVATERRTYEAFRDEADALLRDAVVAQLEAKRQRGATAQRAGKALGMSMAELGAAGGAATETQAMRTELKRRLMAAAAATEEHQRVMRAMVKGHVKETMRFLKRSTKGRVEAMDSTTEWHLLADADELMAATARPYETFSVGARGLGQVTDGGR